MTLARLPDIDLFYQSHGDGRPLVFIHGAGGSHASWWRQAPEFQANHRVIAYDQRGFGGSRPKSGYDPGDAGALTRDLAALLDHLGVTEPAVIVGHSLGTLSALDFAEANPNRVAGLVLSSAYGGLATPALSSAIERRAALFASAPPPAAPPRTKRSVDEAGPFSMFDQEPRPFSADTCAQRPDLVFLYSTLAALAGGPSRQEIAPVFATMRRISEAQAGAMRMPVLVIGGEHDLIFPPSELAIAAEAFSNGRFAHVKSAGHSAYFEQAEVFNSELRAFLAGL